MSSNLPYYLGFSHFLGIGPIRFANLLKYFGTVKAAYEGKKSEIQSAIGDKIGEEFVDFRKLFNPTKKLAELKQKEITILTQEDSRFPKQLMNISDVPICLYVKGNLDTIDFEKNMFFGIVGTRVPTSYGAQVARMFASGLAAAGCVIVSGLALGVDAISHQAAVDQQGKTVAFLGCGVDIVYPRANNTLYEHIVNTYGLVISEFPPGMMVQRGLFIARNRLISGLSRGVMVVEGLKDSGSLITARYAAEQGKEVFAPPVPITSRNSEAPNLLLKEGAKLVTSVEDILSELNLRQVPTSHAEIRASLSEKEKKLYDLLTTEPCKADDISSRVGFPIHEVLSLLSSLEIKGVIERNGEGKYQVKI